MFQVMKVNHNRISWEIYNSPKIATKLFYPPSPIWTANSEYARAWDVFEQRYGKE